MIKNDGYKVMTSYNRRGPMFTTKFVENEGYYWKHVNSNKWAGPFKTRKEAESEA